MLIRYFGYVVELYDESCYPYNYYDIKNTELGETFLFNAKISHKSHVCEKRYGTGNQYPCR